MAEQNAVRRFSMTSYEFLIFGTNAAEHEYIIFTLDWLLMCVLIGSERKLLKHFQALLDLLCHERHLVYFQINPA